MEMTFEDVRSKFRWWKRKTALSFSNRIDLGEAEQTLDIGLWCGMERAKRTGKENLMTSAVTGTARWWLQDTANEESKFHRRNVSVEDIKGSYPDVKQSDEIFDRLPKVFEEGISFEEKVHFWMIVGQVRDSLEERDRKILDGLIFGFNQNEIAKMIGVSNAKVSFRMRDVIRPAFLEAFER